MSLRLHHALTVVCLISLGTTEAAHATTFDVYGAGARGAAMNAQVASPEGAYAIYYNVGGLALVEPGVTLSLNATSVNAEILLSPRPSGYDVPNLGGDTPTLPSDETLSERGDTSDFDPRFGLTLGAVTSFGIPDFRAGLLVFLPTSNAFALATRHPDEKERLFSNQLQFEIVDQSTSRLDVEAGVSYRATQWLSFGVGGTYMPGTNLVTNVYLPDPADQSNVLTTSNIKTESAWGLLAGVAFILPQNIQVGLSYRSALKFAIEGENRLQLTGLDTDEKQPVQQIDWTPTSSPANAALGLSWAVGDFVIMGDVRYTLWSDYKGTQSETTDFDDTISGYLGTEYLYSEASRVRAGAGFVPSPVPKQTGRTNYVDNDRLSFSTGSAHRFKVSDVDFEVSWYLQLQVLLTNVVEKDKSDSYPDCATAGNSTVCDEVPDDLVDPNTGQPYVAAQGLQTGNPGFPGYSSGGWLGSLGLEVTF